MRTKLAELMVRRKYHRDNIMLPNNFWNIPKYKPDYLYQLYCATKLIKAYDEKAIWNVINREEWIYSLGLSKLDNMIKKEEIHLQRQQFLAEQKTSEPVVENPIYRKKKKENFKDIL